MRCSVTCYLMVFFLSLCSTCLAQVTSAPSRDDVYKLGKASADGSGKFYFEREIALVMGAAGSDWLERDSRQQEENTRRAIDEIRLPANATVADIGAGTGYYAFQLAKKFPAGRVYAVDIQDEMIRYLQNRKALLKDTVVAIVKGTEQSPNLPPNSVDLALMVDVYHELAYPHEMLQAIRTALKPGGKILLIEYRGEDPSIPIKALHKTTVQQLNRELGANGFTLKSKGEFLPIQHFLLYEKK